MPKGIDKKMKNRAESSPKKSFLVNLAATVKIKTSIKIMIAQVKI